MVRHEQPAGQEWRFKVGPGEQCSVCGAHSGEEEGTGPRWTYMALELKVCGQGI